MSKAGSIRKVCGHPLEHRRNGRCLTCRSEAMRRYRATPAGRAASQLANKKCNSTHREQRRQAHKNYYLTPVGREKARLNSAEQYAKGNARAYREAHLAQSADAQRAYQAQRRAYIADLSMDTPERRVKVVDVRSLVVLSDLQIPFDDGPAVLQAIEVIKKVRPDAVVLAGDIVDCFAESSFVKDEAKAFRAIPAAHRKARLLMEMLQDVPKKFWLGGNHEDRWRKLLWSGLPTALRVAKAHEAATGNPVVLTDFVASFASLYDMEKFGFTYCPYMHRLYFAEGNLIITHGKYANRHSGISAKRTWEWLGKSCIVGHSHRMGSYLITQDGHESGAWENGCLCQLEPEYDDTPNWQQGFSVVHIDGPEFHVIQVPIVRRGKEPVAVYHGAS